MADAASDMESEEGCFQGLRKGASRDASRVWLTLPAAGKSNGKGRIWGRNTTEVLRPDAVQQATRRSVIG